MKTIRVEKQDWLIRVIFDLPGEKVNKLSSSVMAELDQVLSDIAQERSYQVVSFESAKNNIFIAGADIEELQAIRTVTIARDKAQAGQQMFSRIADLPQTTVAVINGACVGGGCELALACDFRLATDNPKTKIGLPEVQLGIIPGWGGTQRLPRLIGLPEALKIILPGKTVDARKASKIKLVDKVVTAALLEVEQQNFFLQLRDSIFCASLKKNRKPKRKMQYLISRLLQTSIGRSFVIKQATKNVLKTTKGMYPAPLAALDVLSQSCSFEQGIERELEAFAKLAVGDISKNLISLYFLNEQVKKESGSDFTGEITAPSSGAVLGSGVMGGGIAWLMSHRGLSVRMKDISWEAISLGYAEAARYFAQLKKRRRIKQEQIDRAMNRIGAGIDYQGFSRADVVIEAVVENMEVKKQVLAEAEEYLCESALLCTNTSALSVSEMAGVLKRPQNFCGMHFFNPVNRMPLVEIIRGEESSEEIVARAVATVKGWGKIPVVVGNCPGFLVNRILLPYMNEAAYLLEEGAAVDSIDQAVTDFGMPMGPFQLADEVGIDVGYKVAQILEQGFGERMAVCSLLKTVYEDYKLLGKKGGTGFYHYHNKKSEVNSLIYQAPSRAAPKEHDHQEMIDRLLIIMVNEAAYCLQEGIVADAGQLDLAMVMGTGFPPWRGGLCRWADSVGLDTIVKKCEVFNAQADPRYQVSPYLRELADAGRGFYS
ncbi:3-hydroxyacyl-CoA dehydrogenase NAD-binding domain-containing protein [Psychromonas aquimarina]|uniref:3-hydroxyacyl-CoA dehydrogenase NAD-binding domain-containing protein n=1 Tax=Psychromonas aquimarina TaxID=444919 RepID=UPI0003FDF9D3|nr:3-hydroxyacyl-CoA dehydrogenase NAD-binding domain-containing protein [Psychromonas aquimarina]